MAKNKHKKPKQIFASQVYVYPCDYDEEGEPILAVTANLEDVEEGEPVGIYYLAEVKGKVIKETVVTFEEKES